MNCNDGASVWLEGRALASRAYPSYRRPMLLKIIALLAAAIPLFILLRRVFFRRDTKLGAALREFKKQVDVGIWIFLGLIGCVVAFGLGKLIWTWWSAI